MRWRRGFELVACALVRHFPRVSLENARLGVDTEPFAASYRGRRVLVTGHTGFKGAWLAEWLLALGAEVTGLSLDPPTQPALFDQLGLAGRLHDRRVDLREASAVREVIEQAQPDYIFHLAAQAIVRESYARPEDTFAVNVQGTANLLGALRGRTQPCAVVCVTSDKCYENRGWVFGYRENDPLGGHDPYSASKGAAEIVIASMRRSFFADGPVRVASARAGNVIGGGDWAKDRILPDSMKALARGEPIPVRNPRSTRPWQHVLEPLSGYLWLGALLRRPELRTLKPEAVASAFNFGPGADANRTVAELVGEILQHWPGRWEDRSDPRAPHEASLLQLATDKARAVLGWAPVWSFREAIERTVQWYRANQTQADAQAMQALTAAQIAAYTSAARERGSAWIA